MIAVVVHSCHPAAKVGRVLVPSPKWMGILFFTLVSQSYTTDLSYFQAWQHSNNCNCFKLTFISHLGLGIHIEMKSCELNIRQWVQHIGTHLNHIFWLSLIEHEPSSCLQLWDSFLNWNSNLDKHRAPHGGKSVHTINQETD